MHTFFAGVVKYCLLWILGLIRFGSWGTKSEAMAALNRLNLAVRGILTLHSERRIPFRRFPDGVGFIINSAKSKDGINRCGGGMVSRDWFPALCLVLSVLLDEQLHKSNAILPSLVLDQCVLAASRVTGVFFSLKQCGISSGQLGGLQEQIQRFVRIVQMHKEVYKRANA
jgi:hypothetical protein